MNPSPQNRPPMKLVLKDVAKTFETESQSIPALAPVNMEINEGEFVVFVGPSGCGKSTLLNMIAGFIKPSSGSITLNGAPIKKPGRDRLMMFQEHALFPWLNVIDNVSYGLKRNWFKLRERRERARELLRMVHLEKFEKSYVHELSGGMKQRVALARALAPDPKMLLIDEPFPALDAVTRLKLYTELQEVYTATKKTIIFITHEMQEAACLGDRVFIFSGRPGRVMREIKLDLPRPRDFNGEEVRQRADFLLQEFKQTDVENSK